MWQQLPLYSVFSRYWNKCTYWWSKVDLCATILSAHCTNVVWFENRLRIFQVLLPENCCQIIGFSSKYQESFRCNFLGLSVGVNLPEHIVNSEFHVLLDILPPLKVSASCLLQIYNKHIFTYFILHVHYIYMFCMCVCLSVCSWRPVLYMPQSRVRRIVLLSSTCTVQFQLYIVYLWWPFTHVLAILFLL